MRTRSCRLSSAVERRYDFFLIPEMVKLWPRVPLAKKVHMLHNRTPSEALKTAAEKRVLNEFGSKILNEERLEMVSASEATAATTSHHSTMSFHCECDDKACDETIQMSTEEYQQVHRKTKYFIVIPSHVRLDLEEIVSSFSNYALVAKFFPRSKPDTHRIFGVV
jgi:hypothetical protein